MRCVPFPRPQECQTLIQDEPVDDPPACTKRDPPRRKPTKPSERELRGASALLLTSSHTCAAIVAFNSIVGFGEEENTRASTDSGPGAVQLRAVPSTAAASSNIFMVDGASARGNAWPNRSTSVSMYRAYRVRIDSRFRYCTKVLELSVHSFVA